jgi:RNA polymerase sigma-70 factor (ECF subfamily)
MEDSAIVDLYWQRSERAIEESEQKYGAYCCTVAYNILSDSQDAEECVNDVWLGAWNAMPAARPARLGAFLCKITRNLSLDRLRHRTRLKRGGAVAVLEELRECLPSGCDVAEKVEKRAVLAAVDKFLAALPERDRIAFVGRYWLMIPIRDMANYLNCGENALKSNLHRTRKKLRSYLEQEGLV